MELKVKTLDGGDHVFAIDDQVRGREEGLFLEKMSFKTALDMFEIFGWIKQDNSLLAQHENSSISRRSPSPDSPSWGNELQRPWIAFLPLQASLLSLRESIASRTGVAIANQRLIFQGRVLGDNDRSLHELGLRAGHTLHMVERAPNL